MFCSSTPNLTTFHWVLELSFAKSQPKPIRTKSSSSAYQHITRNCTAEISHITSLHFTWFYRTHEHMTLGQQGCISNETATTSNKVGIKYANIGSRRVKNIHLFFDISTQATSCKPTSSCWVGHAQHRRPTVPVTYQETSRQLVVIELVMWTR